MHKQKFLQLQDLAKANNIDAMLLLGKIFMKGGYGLEPCAKMALFWLTKAAKENNHDAKFLIGRSFSPNFMTELSNLKFACMCYIVAITSGFTQAKIWLAEVKSNASKFHHVHQVHTAYNTKKQSKSIIYSCNTIKNSKIILKQKKSQYLLTA